MAHVEWTWSKTSDFDMNVNKAVIAEYNNVHYCFAYSLFAYSDRVPVKITVYFGHRTEKEIKNRKC